jgi:hypothetical protein
MRILIILLEMLLHVLEHSHPDLTNFLFILTKKSFILFCFNYPLFQSTYITLFIFIIHFHYSIYICILSQ